MSRGRKVGEAYPIRTLHKVFAVLSGLFLISMVWMFWDDYNRPWKGYQQTFMDMQRAREQKKLKALQGDKTLKAALKQVQAEQATAKKAADAKKSQIRKLQDEVYAIDTELKPAIMKMKFGKSFIDEQRYNHDHAAEALLDARRALAQAKKAKKAKKGIKAAEGEVKVAEEHYKAAKAQLEEKRRLHLEAKLEVEKLAAKRNAKQRALDGFLSAQAALTKRSAALKLKQVQLTKRIDDLSTGLMFKVRNAPLIDMLHPNIKVRQVVLPEMKINISFAEVQTVDRCMTCHVAVDMPGWKSETENLTGQEFAQKRRELGDQVTPVTRKVKGKTRIVAEWSDAKQVGHSTLSQWVDNFGPVIQIVKVGSARKQADVSFSEFKNRWKPIYQKHIKVLGKGKTTVKVDYPEQVTAKHVKKIKVTYPIQHPYRTHPDLDLVMGSASPHPMNTFGCRACHEGMGRATDFVRAAHTPTDADEAKRWKKDYHWHAAEPKHWSKPMLPQRLTEAGCVKCHLDIYGLQPMPWMANYGRVDPSEFEVQGVKHDWTGSRVFEGKQLFLRHGCNGCHKVDSALDEPKIAPSLEHVRSKLDKRWMTHWIESPRGFRKNTYMPHSFKIPHHLDPLATVTTTAQDLASITAWDLEKPAEGKKRVDKLIGAYPNRKALFTAIHDVEISAATEFLWQNSTEITLASPGKPGDAATGKTLFRDKGCLACHVMDDYTLEGQPAKRFAPDLSNVATKLDPSKGASWLYTWLLNPRSYHPQARMPDMRLTEDEAAHLAAYLLTKADAAYAKKITKQAKLEPLLIQMRLVDFLSANMSTKQAWTLVRGLDRTAQLAWLGEKVVNKQGCYGCHRMPTGSYAQQQLQSKPALAKLLKTHKLDKFVKAPDFNNIPGIGTELSDWGRKLISKLDFGLQHQLEKNRWTFITHKLDRPRKYDEGLFKAYDDMLRMPHFELTKDQVDKIAMYVLGMKKSPLGKRYIYRQSESNWAFRTWEKQVKEGRLDAQWLNEPAARRQAIIEGRKLVRRHNCNGCHMIENRGWDLQGYIAKHRFRGDDLKANTYSPPWLNYQGERTQTAWLFEFLRNPENHVVRPYLRVKMPNFNLSVEEANTLTRYFAAISGTAWPNAAAYHAPDAEAKAAMKDIFVKNNCFSCHRAEPAAGKEGAPDLELGAVRLRGEWIKRWVLDPKQYVPWTAMPDNLFKGPKGEWVEGHEGKAHGTARGVLDPDMIRDLKKTMMK